LSDPVVSVSGIAVPGLKVAFHIQLTDGAVLDYEAAVDQTLCREDLDELLDRLGGAAERQRAIRELPLCRNRLAKNLRLLPNRRADVAKAKADATAHITIMNANRRNQRDEMPMTDVQAVKGAVDALNITEQTIELDKLMIAYYEAIIDRRDPPDPAAEEPEAATEIPLLAAE